MRYAIIENNIVVNIAVADAPLANNWIDASTANIGDIWNGTNFLPPTIDLDTLKTDIIQQTQNRLDAFAKTRNYDNILSACTYATSPTAKFAAEGQYCVIQRDATWAKLLKILDDVSAGIRPVPAGYAEIEPELPPLIWPIDL